MRIDCVPDAEIDRAVLAVASGHLDAQGASEMWEAVSPQLGGSRSCVLVDMTGVDWISSAGVGTLVRLLTRCQALGGGLALFACAPRVRSVLHICGLDVVLNLSEAGDDARRRLRELGAS